MSAPATVRSRLSAAERDPAGLTDDGYVELLGADGDELEALCALADGLRHDAVGDALSVVVNRNLDADLVDDPEHLDALVDEAWELGATEVCVQGPVPEDAGPDAALDLVRRITARRPLHLHAFRPAEVAQAAARGPAARPASSSGRPARRASARCPARRRASSTTTSGACSPAARTSRRRAGSSW